MSHRRKWTGVFAVVAALAFGYSMYLLFTLRFAVGDVYPPYSSLRNDPLGTRILFESLEELPGVQVERNFKSLPRLLDQGPAMLFMAGAHPFEFHTMPRSLLRSLNRFMSNGGRLVICFSPVWYHSVKESRDDLGDESDEATAGDADEEVEEEGDDAKPRDEAAQEKPAENEADAKRKEEAEKRWKRHFVSVTNAWGIDYGFVKLAVQPEREDEDNPFMERATRSSPEDRAIEDGMVVTETSGISWHTTMIFTNLAPSWNVLFRRAGQPVVIERPFGRGSLVLSSDSYFASNEALVRERHTGLLAHLLGGFTRVVFDESHFGIQQKPGIMGLANKYRLQGAVFGLVLLAFLFVWRNATSLVPAAARADDPADQEMVSGEQAGEGFVRLLRRNIPAGDLAALCLREWEATRPAGRGKHEAAVQRMRDIAAEEAARPSKEKNPVAAYRAISQLLKENEGRP